MRRWGLSSMHICTRRDRVIDGFIHLAGEVVVGHEERGVGFFSKSNWENNNCERIL